MGLFDLLKKKRKTTQSEESEQVQPQRRGYQPEKYYTEKAFEGTQFEKKIITFEERKKISFPSRRGLYVAEILLLEYCSYGTYPQPQNGYPGFWWFEYGIKDIEDALKSLEQRGFIRYASAKELLSRLTVAELKKILESFSIPLNGKKSELIARVQSSVSEEELSGVIPEPKYILTDLGRKELDENAYVPYMHKYPGKTTEDGRFGPILNVWEINRRIGNGDTRNWKEIVEEIEQERKDCQAERAKNHEELLKREELRHPEWIKEMREIDKNLEKSDLQIQKIQSAENQYKSDNNVDNLISFWEDIWENEGVLFNGSRWTFRLPDLYIQEKRYDDALRILHKISDPAYQDKRQSYIEKIKGMEGSNS